MEKEEQHPLVRTSREEAKRLVEKAVRKCATLSSAGLRDPYRRGKERDWTEHPASERFCLAEVAAAADYMKKLKKHRTWNRDCSSYGMKHEVERWFYKRGPGQYVSNGALIAAAVGLDFEFASNDGNTLFPVNAMFKVDKKSMRNVFEAMQLKKQMLEDQLWLCGFPLDLISMAMEYFGEDESYVRKRKRGNCRS